MVVRYGFCILPVLSSYFLFQVIYDTTYVKTKHYTSVAKNISSMFFSLANSRNNNCSTTGYETWYLHKYSWFRSKLGTPPQISC